MSAKKVSANCSKRFYVFLKNCVCKTHYDNIAFVAMHLFISICLFYVLNLKSHWSKECEVHWV